MIQTINILTERERQLDDIDQAIRETEYPPLNGGPTIEDLVGLLKGAAATIEELGDQVDEMDEAAERCDELQDAINDAVNELEDVILDLSELSEGLKKTAEEPQERMICKALEEIEDKIRKIYSDLRRA
jgi:DNA repair exonuclease SbcCD ATPase subunit